jgi:hypothetical protein
MTRSLCPEYFPWDLDARPDADPTDGRHGVYIPRSFANHPSGNLFGRYQPHSHMMRLLWAARELCGIPVTVTILDGKGDVVRVEAEGSADVTLTIDVFNGLLDGQQISGTNVMGGLVAQRLSAVQNPNSPHDVIELFHRIFPPVMFGFTPEDQQFPGNAPRGGPTGTIDLLVQLGPIR